MGIATKMAQQAEEFKIVVVGAGGVGKSGLTLQFCAGKCPKRYDPTIEDSYRKTTEIDGKPCTLDILDTAGQEEYAMLRGEYMTEGKGFVLVYSITNADSFAEMQSFKDQIQANKKAGEAVPIALVGNKVDLEDQRAVSTAQGEDLLRKWKSENSENISNFMFMETSAMTNFNVSELFKGLVRHMMTAENRDGGGGASSGGGSAGPIEASGGDEPKTSGDKANGGCQCVVQ